MKPAACALPLALLLLSSATAPALSGDGSIQHVVISFDGAHDVAQWRRSRALAEETGARFTYFLSCVYLLSPETRGVYQPPRMRTGRSNVGFAASREEVAERLDEIWTARAEGHEIASHGCGHFDGKDWSAADWKSEFGQFSTILRDAYRINGLPLEPAQWRSFAENEIAGFRAPYLSTGAGLDAAMTDAGMHYDASTVSRDPAAPARKGGLWRFALPLIPEGPSERRIIAMDYNLFVRHSGGLEREDADGRFEERTYRAFMDAFEGEYRGDRVPLQVGFHFTLMNGGAYWRALERFAREVCPRPDVRCVSYRDLVQTLEGGTGEDMAQPAAGG